MPIINVTTLQDILGGTAPTDAIFTAYMMRSGTRAVRVQADEVIFPAQIHVNFVDGIPQEVIELETPPADCYWSIRIKGPERVLLRTNVILPIGPGPFDFDELIEVIPETGLPDPGTPLAEAFLEAVELAALGVTGPTGPTGPAGGGGAGGNFTWTAPDDSTYEIYQAHGGIQVETTSYTGYQEFVTAIDYATNQSQIFVSVSEELDAIFQSVFDGSEHLRALTVSINGISRPFVLNGRQSAGQWYMGCQDGNVFVTDGGSYSLDISYGGPPVVWWDADTLGIKSGEDLWYFRGAKIDYHAYGTDSGSLIGTIYIADDSGDNNVTHIEVGSGGNDLGTISLWYKDSNNNSDESKLYLYRTDGESSTTKIQWTAQVYYSPDVWD